MTSSTLSSSSSSSSSSSFFSSFSIGTKSYDDYKKSEKPPLPIPSDLRSKLPDTNTPWNVNPALFKRLKEKPSSSSLYRKETLSSSDPEWAFIHHYFDHERPENRAIGAIHCIYNSTLSRQFEATLTTTEREAALPPYAPAWDKEEQASLRKKVIQRWHTLTAFFSPFSLTDSSRTTTFTRTKILPLWHGTKKEVCDSIAQTGFTYFGKHKFLQGKTDTTSTDIGYFGSGIYFTNSAKYAAEIYSNGHLILAWVTMREPFPVVADTPHPKKPKDMALLEGKGAYQNYNVHYIPVVSVNPKNKKCAVYYPCTDTQTPSWDELVIFQKTQALPRFWVELVVDLPKALSTKPLSQETFSLLPDKLDKKEKETLPSPPPPSLSPFISTTLLTIAFGKVAWAKYFGDIGEEPPLPADIVTLLAAPCPIWPGKKVEETHLLTLVPAKLQGEALTLKRLGELVKTPKEGHKTQYSHFYPGGHETASLEKNSWVLLTRDVLPESRNQPYESQVALVEKFAKKVKASYMVPRLIEVATSLFMHHVRSGERLYSDTYTRCQERHTVWPITWPITMGGFDDSGVSISDVYLYNFEMTGIGVVRKF